MSLKLYKGCGKIRKLKLVYTDDGVSYRDAVLKEKAQLLLGYYRRDTHTTFRIGSLLYIDAIISAVINADDIEVTDVELRHKSKAYPVDKYANFGNFFDAIGDKEISMEFLMERMEYGMEVRTAEAQGD